MSWLVLQSFSRFLDHEWNSNSLATDSIDYDHKIPLISFLFPLLLGALQISYSMPEGHSLFKCLVQVLCTVAIRTLSSLIKRGVLIVWGDLDFSKKLISRAVRNVK